MFEQCLYRNNITHFIMMGLSTIYTYYFELYSKIWIFMLEVRLGFLILQYTGII